MLNHPRVLSVYKRGTAWSVIQWKKFILSTPMTEYLRHGESAKFFFWGTAIKLITSISQRSQADPLLHNMICALPGDYHCPNRLGQYFQC